MSSGLTCVAKCFTANNSGLALWTKDGKQVSVRVLKVCHPVCRRGLSWFAHEGDALSAQRLVRGAHALHAENDLRCAGYVRSQVRVAKAQPQHHRAALQQDQRRFLHDYLQAQFLRVKGERWGHLAHAQHYGDDVGQLDWICHNVSWWEYI